MKVHLQARSVPSPFRRPGSVGLQSKPRRDRHYKDSRLGLRFVRAAVAAGLAWLAWLDVQRGVDGADGGLNVGEFDPAAVVFDRGTVGYSRRRLNFGDGDDYLHVANGLFLRALCGEVRHVVQRGVRGTTK